MNKQILIITFLLFSILGNAQTKSDSPIKQVESNLFIGVGANYSDFKDKKYSDLQYNGLGLLFTIGYNRNKKNSFWETALDFNYEKEAAAGAATKVLNAVFYLKYLKPIKNNFKIGARLDLLDLYTRNTEGLGNNGKYEITGHHLFGSVMHDYKLNNEWHLQSSLDVGLLSFMRESTGFAFSAPQNALEKGEFSYQNKAMYKLFGYKYFDWKYFGNSLNIKTSFVFQYKKRISIGYKWSVKYFANVKSYPVIIGMHNIVFTYNIPHK